MTTRRLLRMALDDRKRVADVRKALRAVTWIPPKLPVGLGHVADIDVNYRSDEVWAVVRQFNRSFAARAYQERRIG